jgi:hypothetical protein
MMAASIHMLQSRSVLWTWFQADDGCLNPSASIFSASILQRL